MDRLKAAIPEGINPASLSGYAPVLALVSELLDVGNPFAEYQSILPELREDKFAFSDNLW
jgi:hypothetical protein